MRPCVASGWWYLAASVVNAAVSSSADGSVAVAGGWWAWTRFLPATATVQALGVGLVIALGVTVYGALVWRLHVQGREDVATLLEKLRGKFARRSATTS